MQLFIVIFISMNILLIFKLKVKEEKMTSIL